MDPALILQIISKAIDVIETVVENKDLVFKATAAIKNLLDHRNPTQADIDATEVTLDALLAEFNAPLPE